MQAIRSAASANSSSHLPQPSVCLRTSHTHTDVKNLRHPTFLTRADPLWEGLNQRPLFLLLTLSTVRMLRAGYPPVLYTTNLLLLKMLLKSFAFEIEG